MKSSLFEMRSKYKCGSRISEAAGTTDMAKQTRETIFVINNAITISRYIDSRAFKKNNEVEYFDLNGKILKKM